MQKRIPQLDGVRGVAILLVFVAHLLDGVWPHEIRLLPFLPHGGHGGFIGVQLFFALSGYLITSILLSELESTARISFGQFYLRRARRLLPALFSVCALYLLYVVIAGEAWRPALGAVARAVTYTTNLHYPWRSVPDSRWLDHCWSLAVEEQFYLLWPPSLLVAWRFGRRAAIGVAIAGAGAMIAMRAVPAFASIRYEVLRWDALMAGVILALSRFSPPRIVGLVGALGVGYFAVQRPSGEISNLEYTLAAACSALFVSFAMQTRFFANRVLAYFGRISYGLYLWHVVLMRTGMSPWVAGPASVVVSDVSYRFFEVRFLKARLKADRQPTPPPREEAEAPRPNVAADG